MGLGIDENTAGSARSDRLGGGRRWGDLVDGRGVKYSNAGTRRDGMPLTLIAVRVDIVGAGHSSSLDLRELSTPTASAP